METTDGRPLLERITALRFVGKSPLSAGRYGAFWKIIRKTSLIRLTPTE
jgi:hypothetical protein